MSHSSDIIAETIANLKQFLHKDGWSPVQDLPGEPSFSMTYRGEHGRYNCLAHVYVERGFFAFFVHPNIDMSGEDILNIAKFATIVNNYLIFGLFAVDLDGGAVQFKSSIPIRERTISTQILQEAIYNAVQTMDMFFRASSE